MQEGSALGRDEMGVGSGQCCRVGVGTSRCGLVVWWSGRSRIAIVQGWQKLGKDGSGWWKMCQSIRDV